MSNNMASSLKTNESDRTRCRICGKTFNGLSRHVYAAHNMRAVEYKDRFGIPRTAGLVSDETRKKFHDIGVGNDLGRKRLVPTCNRTSKDAPAIVLYRRRKTEAKEQRAERFRQLYTGGMQVDDIITTMNISCRSAKTYMRMHGIKKPTRMNATYVHFLKIANDGLRVIDMATIVGVSRATIHAYINKRNGGGQ